MFHRALRSSSLLLPRVVAAAPLQIACASATALSPSISRLFTHVFLLRKLLVLHQYAVEYLKVKDIIVCGHYGCGGVHAAVDNKHLGLLDNWLRNIRDVARIHSNELQEISDHDQRMRRMVELNTIEQCINVFKIGLVQRHQVKYGFPRIHGLVYDLKNGQLNEMDIDFDSYVQKYQSIYKLHSFPAEVPKHRSQLQCNMIRSLAEGHDEEPGRVSVKFMKRAMSKEPILFSETEINSAITRAQEDETDDSTVDIEKIVSYFDH
ncbi:unnamed protein product [Peronospora belbahrii]|uniref:Carbonic anhydrase n=1 Tax=Peronospora belbahrii TaxID=622444 RepID=A0ABN8D1J6_9STRA|nr:unnamed protein product [Peronospora belbahrii]